MAFPPKTTKPAEKADTMSGNFCNHCGQALPNADPDDMAETTASPLADVLKELLGVLSKK